jgi:two-component sensor histidine kinase
VLLAIATLVFLYSKYKANLALKEKKATIEKTLGEKELLLREIHHRVKNNLQVISSLLNLQSRYISDEKAIAAIKDGRNRVNSMSLIHQDLYLNENLTTIDLGLYLEKLSDSLFQSYNIDPTRIRLDTSVEQARLDVDTLIPLGLILNELLSNALKHAFPNERAGEVSVRFQESEEHYFLEVKDNGVGMYGKSPESSQESFGIQMIKAFAQKLKASVEFKTMNGVTASLVIPKTHASVS